MVRLSLIVLALVTSAPILGGCSARLEDGYQPKKLSASASERKLYYAPAFTPEALQAQHDSGAPSVGPNLGH